MDFFTSQARAHRKTRLLILYFLLAVISIAVTVYIVLWLLLAKTGNIPPIIWNPQLFLYAICGVSAIVTIGSLYKISELAQGGEVVASLLGGKPLDPVGAQPDERRLINVVEEMALASGVPIPTIYVLEEDSINAFAAGFAAGDAVIGVTRGCIQKLNRDELQGVIAHEFSHILNGDMKLNIRLMGLLNGIICLAILGRVIMEIGAYSRSSRDDGKDGNGLQIILLVGGIALIVIGGIGVFFGKLIKAAISRQREFLADASSVQFTRNPAGICGALYKISQDSSKIKNPHAEEASHLFFGNGVGASWMSFLDTHPSIEERIRAVDPSFEPSTQRAPLPTPEPPPKKTSVLRHIGAPLTDHLQSAVALLAAIPEEANVAVRDLHGAQKLICGLLLSDDETVRTKQLAGLLLPEEQKSSVLSYYQQYRVLPREQKITLIDLSIPTLRNLTSKEYQQFQSAISNLIAADKELDLFEYVLQKILTRHLSQYFTKQAREPAQYSKLEAILPDALVLLAGIAQCGHEHIVDRTAAYETGVRELTGTDADAAEPAEYGLPEVDAALNRLAMATPALKHRVLHACEQTVMQDGKLEDQESALLRAVADTLDCPLPPILTNHTA
ncbi:MAG: M48 family metallopeptidase [Chthoniobacterales bacterium]